MTIEAMKQALEALENTTPTGFNMERDKQFYAAITALRTAIAEAEKQEPTSKQSLQVEQEPVAKVRVHMTGGNPGLHWSVTAVNSYDSLPPLADGTLLYTAAQEPGPVSIKKVAEGHGMNLPTEFVPKRDEFNTAIRSLTDQCAALIQERDELQKRVWQYEKLTPLSAQRQPLTDEQIDDIWNRYCDEMGEASINDAYDIARAIEAAHGIFKDEK